MAAPRNMSLRGLVLQMPLLLLELPTRKNAFDADRRRSRAHALLGQFDLHSLHAIVEIEDESGQLVDPRFQQRRVSSTRPLLCDPTAQRLVVDALVQCRRT